MNVTQYYLVKGICYNSYARHNLRGNIVIIIIAIVIIVKVIVSFLLNMFLNAGEE